MKIMLGAAGMKVGLQKCARRSKIFLVYLTTLMFVVAVIAFFAHSYLGFLFLIAAIVFFLIGFVVAAHGTFSLRCWHCNERFLSITYPVWPFQNYCAHCCTAINEPD